MNYIIIEKVEKSRISTKCPKCGLPIQKDILGKIQGKQVRCPFCFERFILDSEVEIPEDLQKHKQFLEIKQKNL